MLSLNGSSIYLYKRLKIIGKLFIFKVYSRKFPKCLQTNMNNEYKKIILLQNSIAHFKTCKIVC